MHRMATENDRSSENKVSERPVLQKSGSIVAIAHFRSGRLYSTVFRNENGYASCTCEQECLNAKYGRKA
jgi:hypothetical protein